jgi:hypothetical protein
MRKSLRGGTILAGQTGCCAAWTGHSKRWPTLRGGAGFAAKAHCDTDQKRSCVSRGPRKGETALGRFTGPLSGWEGQAEGKRSFPLKMQRSRFYRLLSRPVSQGDVDGRIIFNGFATAKNFSDWILNFSDHSRQVKMKAKKCGCNLLKRIHLPVINFSTR